MRPMKTLFEQHRENIDYFFQRIDVDKAEKILKFFLACKGNIIFSGVGKSGIIADKLAKTMISTGTKALYLPPANALHGDIGIVTEDDIVVFISKSGETKELLSLLPYFKQKKIATTAWVCSENSKLQKFCDNAIYLPLDKELCPFDLAPTTSTAIQMIFGDVLSVALMKAKKFTLGDYALNHPEGTISKKITLKVTDLMIDGEALPVCHPEDRLTDVLDELSKKRCGCLVVTDHHKVHGIFTDGDLRRALQEQIPNLLDKPMKDLMTTSYLSVEKGERAIQALQKMQNDPKKWITVMPVTYEDKLVGLIRMHDIVQSGIS